LSASRGSNDYSQLRTYCNSISFCTTTTREFKNETKQFLNLAVAIDDFRSGITEYNLGNDIQALRPFRIAEKYHPLPNPEQGELYEYIANTYRRNHATKYTATYYYNKAAEAQLPHDKNRAINNYITASANASEVQNWKDALVNYQNAEKLIETPSLTLLIKMINIFESLDKCTSLAKHYKGSIVEYYIQAAKIYLANGNIDAVVDYSRKAYLQQPANTELNSVLSDIIVDELSKNILSRFKKFQINTYLHSSSPNNDFARFILMQFKKEGFKVSDINLQDIRDGKEFDGFTYLKENLKATRKNKNEVAGEDENKASPEDENSLIFQNVQATHDLYTGKDTSAIDSILSNKIALKGFQLNDKERESIIERAFAKAEENY
jgi:hypothetical protein